MSEKNSSCLTQQGRPYSMCLSIGARQLSRREEREGESVQREQSGRRRVGEGAHGQMRSTKPGPQHARTDVDTDRRVDQAEPA